ncbi:MAG TPA: hypothetical protein PLE74_06775 [Candidatus Cloacimonadota bacterium]|nr:hypothetical protein [Candidatus Cloacimonadota bacterium]HPT71968.1 hypothetical protein [Candidatus Cloacimonadota bacterium]
MPTGGFVGTYEVSVYKQRIMLPTQFQKKLNAAAKQTFILTIGYDNTIAAYSLDNWTALVNRLQNGSEDDQDFLDDLYYYASEQQLEGPGRLKISDDLMRLAQVKDVVKVMGVGTYLSIFSPEHLEKRHKKIEENAQSNPRRKWNV